MATVMVSCAVSAPRVASISGDNSTWGTGEADTTRATQTLSSEKWGCLTYSLQLHTPCCYSSSARYLCAKHASLVEEATPHLVEPHKLSRVLSSCEHFPLVRVWFYTQ